MGKLVKKNSSFIYWVLLPSILLIASVFGVNLVSRPAVSLLGSFGCSLDIQCDSVRFNPCITEACNTVINTNGECVISSYTTGGNCDNCDFCGNGRCEPRNGENSVVDTLTGALACPVDCDLDLGTNSFQVEDVCRTGDITCGNTLNGVPGGIDGCCPAPAIGGVFCQGDNPNGPNFDADCCVRCGNGIIDSVTGGEECEPTVTAPGCPAGLTCDAVTCQCTGCGDGVVTAPEECEPSLNGGQCTDAATSQPGVCDNLCQCIPNPFCGDGTITAPEECEPPSSANCDANCQIIQVCGNGVVEVGEECEGTTCNATINGEAIPGVCQGCLCFPECQVEGAGCGNDGTGNPGVCFAGTGGTGGSSLIPVGVHTGVLAQWLAAFALPGVTFVGLKLRRRFKK